MLALFPYYAHLLPSAEKSSVPQKTNQQPAIDNKPCISNIMSFSLRSPLRALCALCGKSLASVLRSLPWPESNGCPLR